VLIHRGSLRNESLPRLLVVEVIGARGIGPPPSIPRLGRTRGGREGGGWEARPKLLVK